MKNLLSIIFTLVSLSAFAQNKIVLKDQSYIKDAEYKNVKNSIIEYLQNGSLHDIEAEKVLWAEKADGTHLYFDEKGNAYVKTVPVIDAPQKPIAHTETDKNKAYSDSVALDEQKRTARKAAYEKELEHRYAITSPNTQAPVYDSIVSNGSSPDNKMLEINNAKLSENRRRTSSNQGITESAALEYYSDRSPEYRQGHVDGKLYRSKVSKYDIPNPMDINKLPIPERYINSNAYKGGFIHGIRTKQKQRTMAVALPLIGAGIIVSVYAISLLGGIFIQH